MGFLKNCLEQMEKTHHSTRRLNVSMINLMNKIDEWKNQLNRNFNSKILVIDDESFVLHCFCDMIKDEMKNSIVKGVSNYDIASSLIKDFKWDIFVIDLDLKDLKGRTGINLVDEIRNSKRNIDSFIVITTGVIPEKLKELTHMSSVNVAFEKPVDHKELIFAIKSYLLKSSS